MANRLKLAVVVVRIARASHVDSHGALRQLDTLARQSQPRDKVAPTADASKAKKKSPADDRALVQFSIAATQIANVLQTTIRWGGSVWISYYFYLAIVSLAGQETIASIVLSVLGNLTFSSTVAWSVAVGGVGYGVWQKKLKEGAIKRLHGRIKALETNIDPGRSSSGLTKAGNTNPGDKR